MNRSLTVQAIGKFLLGVALVGLLIFVPAGTLDYGAGWLLMGLLFVPMCGAGFVMLVRRPTLLASRLRGRERLRGQGTVVRLSGLMFVAGFVTAGLNRRFGWHSLPDWVCPAAAVVFVAAYLLYGEVLRENIWLSRTVEVQPGQQVVDGGLYGVVRHPMYTATVLLFGSMPLILGSVQAFCIFLLYLPLIVCRIGEEERFLERELEGYAQYRRRVKYRLLPFVW